MDRTLRQHINHLEERIKHLSDELMDERRTQVERNRIQAEIRVAELALTHYRTALALEGEITSATQV